jgi:hypothetical protein
MENSIESMLEVFVEPLLETFQIDWISSRCYTFREPIFLEHLSEGLPA